MKSRGDGLAERWRSDGGGGGGTPVIDSKVVMLQTYKSKFYFKTLRVLGHSLKSCTFRILVFFIRLFSLSIP